MLIARNLNPERNISPELVNEAEDLAKKYTFNPDNLSVEQMERLHQIHEA
jgi:hypothetical protein